MEVISVHDDKSVFVNVGIISCHDSIFCNNIIINSCVNF